MRDCQIYAADDAELYQFWRPKIHTARKQHKCGECGDEIPVGAKYEASTGLYDGEWAYHKTCLLCVEIRDKLFCSWLQGNIWEDLRDESVMTVSLKGLSVPALEKLEAFWRRYANP